LLLDAHTHHPDRPLHDRPVLITGAAGFIGSHTADRLLARGQRVVGLDNFDPFYPAEIKRANLAPLLAHPGFSFVEGDIADAPRVGAVFREYRPVGVIHLAGKAGVRPSIADPVGYARANVMGTAVLLEAARAASVERFVLASSSSVYGNNPKVPFAETDDVSAPISPYAATKRSCELLAHAHWSLTRMPTACLRFFTVFGPRQRPDLAISSFMRSIATGRPITLFGDGSTSRDYTFIDDIVTGVLAAYDRVHEHGYRIWNLGGSSPTTLADMVATIERVVGRTAVVRREPAQPGDVERTFADVTRSRRELAFAPATSFERGVAAQWAWMRRELGPEHAG
jgi:UDP-glucuronate 4-epimerase